MNPWSSHTFYSGGKIPDYFSYLFWCEHSASKCSSLRSSQILYVPGINLIKEVKDVYSKNYDTEEKN